MHLNWFSPIWLKKFIKPNLVNSGHCEIVVRCQEWTSASHSAVFWFIFQLFVKLPTVTQKAAASPNSFHTYTVKHQQSYLSLSWASFLHTFTFHLSYITYTLLLSHLSLPARPKIVLPKSNHWETKITDVTCECSMNFLAKTFLNSIIVTVASFQGVVIYYCVPMVSVCSGMHWRMNVSQLTVCPVQRCFAKENRGSCFTESFKVCHPEPAWRVTSWLYIQSPSLLHLNMF